MHGPTKVKTNINIYIYIYCAFVGLNNKHGCIIKYLKFVHKMFTPDIHSFK